ncbi:MAG: hypothetical protein R3F49_12420 [Planctomycetota bacterium]
MYDDPNMTLVSSALEAALPALAADAASESAWTAVRAALAHHGVSSEADPELFAVIAARDAAQLAKIVGDWTSGKRLMLERDRDVLKRALKAYRKSLKVTVLDAESSVAGGPMSAGRKSTILGIVPPNRYPRAVWDELVRQKRLVDAGRGIYELAPGM